MVSHAFRAADSQRAFLRFVATEALAGRGKEIKEYSIAIEAFGRGTDFDPRLDPIVRTQARKLRARLTAYYEIEGSSDAIRIELRKGSYAPVFHRACASALLVSEKQVRPPLLSVEATIPAGPPIAATDRRRAILVGGAILAMCAVAAFYLIRDRGLQLAAGKGRGSLAVMPLVNASGEPAEELLGDSLSRSLIDLLRRVPGLKVVTRTSPVGEQKSAVREIGRTLHVGSVLTGSFAKSGTRIRVKVQLSDAADGAHLWSGSYEGEASGMQIVEREITQEVIGVLQPATPD